MIYTPAKNPKEAFLLISLVVLFGVLGAVFVHYLFIIIALLFWLQYTAILSYLQFAKKKRFKAKGFTDYLLNPQIRFFVFVFVATLGIGSVFLGPQTIYIGIASLIIWWLFSLNFFVYYRQFRRYE